MLKVSRLPSGEPEIFHSLQGEGASIGTPSVFLRLATCNLACTWCDTKYTWDWSTYDYSKEVMELSQERVLERILAFGCHHLVITGGEPLVQQKALGPLVKALKAQGYAFEVETNGTIPPVPDLARDIDQWNVSPKLANSGNAPGQRSVPPALSAFACLPTAYFKFVVTDPRDMEEVRALLKSYQLPHQRVILMPEGRDRETLDLRSRWLSRLCADEGFRFSPRLHILLWGDRRGS